VVGIGDLVASGNVPLSLSLTTPIEQPEEEEVWDISQKRHSCYWWWNCEEKDNTGSDEPVFIPTDTFMATHKGNNNQK